MTRTTHIIAGVFATILLLAAPAAAGWKFEEFMNPEGDRGIGITLAPANATGVELAFGCQGARWRQVAILPDGPKPLRLASDGRVSLGFSPDKLTPDGEWKVRERSDVRAYFAPSASSFMGRLFDAERANPNATLYVVLRPAKKAPITLEFPIAGLRDALRKHIWEDCKLADYYGDLD